MFSEKVVIRALPLNPLLSPGKNGKCRGLGTISWLGSIDKQAEKKVLTSLRMVLTYKQGVRRGCCLLADKEKKREKKGGGGGPHIKIHATPPRQIFIDLGVHQNF